MWTFFIKLCLFYCFYIVSSGPSSEILHPEINDQFETTTKLPNETTQPDIHTYNKPVNSNVIEEMEIKDYDNTDNATKTDVENPQRNLISKLFKSITEPIQKFIAIPKVNIVFRNIGTCIVNGAMEIISFYFPAPLIPLIASAAGVVIPFEPVVTLRRRMPVTSYRRAFKSAVNSFLGTFHPYKVDNYDDDPYMTRRFNRRFMNDASKEITKNDDKT